MSNHYAVYGGRNLTSTLFEGHRRKIITFVSHKPSGADFRINLDALLGNKTDELRKSLANFETTNTIIPLPQCWTTKSERIFLKTLNDALYRTLWDHPLIKSLRTIFVERNTDPISIDVFFDLIGLHILSNFLTDRPQIMFDTIGKIRDRLANPAIRKPKSKKKKRSVRIEPGRKRTHTIEHYGKYSS